MNKLTDEFITYKLIKPVPEPGNTVSIERGNGAVSYTHLDVYKRQPYGNILRMEGNAAEDNPIRFSSEYADDELGLVYYNYRYYNPQNGR